MCKSNLAPIELKVIKIEEEDNAFSLILPTNETYTMALSGWIYSMYSEKKFKDAKVWISRKGAFELFEQFSLSQIETYPHFVARGTDAYEALNIIKKAYLSFNPENFDSDGYYIKKSV